jgi:hypothetical protein
LHGIAVMECGLLWEDDLPRSKSFSNLHEQGLPAPPEKGQCQRIVHDASIHELAMTYHSEHMGFPLIRHRHNLHIFNRNRAAVTFSTEKSQQLRILSHLYCHFLCILYANWTEYCGLDIHKFCGPLWAVGRCSLTVDRDTVRTAVSPNRARQGHFAPLIEKLYETSFTFLSSFQTFVVMKSTSSA